MFQKKPTHHLLAPALMLGLLWCFSLSAFADTRSGPERQTVLEQPWGTLFCSKDCSFTPSASGQSYTVKTPDGPVSVMNLNPWLQVQAPNGKILRVRSTDKGNETEILVQLDNRNYRIFRRSGEVEWNFPDDRVYYKTQDGQLRDVLGNKGSLKVRRNFQKNTFRVESDGQATDYELTTIGGKLKGQNKATYKLKLVDGDSSASYPYLYRGVTFELGGVGIYLPLTSGKFTNALEWNQMLSYKTPIVKAASAVEPALTPTGATDDDPLNLKMKPNKLPYRAADPLKAKSNSNGDDPLKLKSIDPTGNKKP